MSRTERLLIGGVGTLAILAMAALLAVSLNLFGGSASSVPSEATPVGSAIPAVEGSRDSSSAAAAPQPSESRPAPEKPPRTKLERFARGEGHETPRREGEGTLLGRIVDPSFHPVSGAAIEVRRGRNFLGDETEARTTRYQGRSVGDGTFRIAGVEAGDRYLLIVTHAGHAAARQRAISVRAGEETRVPDVVLSRGGMISGIVSDRSGVPLHEAKVIADDSPFAGVDIWTIQADSAMTDLDGRYRIEHLPVGQIKVFAAAKGFAPSSQFDVDVTEDRETSGVNFLLEPAATITGAVRDSAAQPVEGAKVYATATDFRDVSRSTTLTDSQGKYVLDGLSPGMFYVFVDKDGFTRPDKRTVKAGTADVDFQLEPNGSISGKVVDRASGEPLSLFVVRYGQARESQALGLGFRKEFDSATGEFTVTDLDAGFYVLEVLTEGYAPKRTEPLEVKKQGRIEGILVAVDHGGTMRGHVRRANDRAPIAGAVVMPRRMRADSVPIVTEIGARPNRERSSATTDASGAFEIANVGTGSYALEVTHPQYAPGKVEGIDVPEGATVDVGELLLYRGGTVVGVVHGKNGAPDSEAQVMLTGKGFERKVRTNAQGRFEFGGVPPGDYTISALVRGGQVDFEGLLQSDEDGRHIVVADGQTLTVDL